jgi:hypothetical protein
MAKKAAKKRRVRVIRVRRRHRLLSPKHRDYQVWAHDFDAALHGLLRNPGILTIPPMEVALRCSEIADAIRSVQAPRRPKGYDSW